MNMSILNIVLISHYINLISKNKRTIDKHISLDQTWSLLYSIILNIKQIRSREIFNVLITTSKNKNLSLSNLNSLTNLSWNKSIPCQKHLRPLIPINIILLYLSTNLILMCSPSSKNNNFSHVMNRDSSSGISLMSWGFKKSPLITLQRISLYCIDYISFTILTSNNIKKVIHMNQLKIKFLLGHTCHLNELKSLSFINKIIRVDLISCSEIFLFSSNKKDSSIWNQNRSRKVRNLERDYKINKAMLLAYNVIKMEFGLVPFEPVNNLRNSNISRVESYSIKREFYSSNQRPLDLL